MTYLLHVYPGVKTKTGMSALDPKTVRKLMLPTVSISLLVLLSAVSSIAKPNSRPTARKSNNQGLAKSEAWILDQRSDEGGRQQAVLSRDALKLNFKNLTAIITAPQFNAVIYNDDSKKFVVLSRKEWMTRYSSTRRAPATPTKKHAKICGMEASCFRVPVRGGGRWKEIWMTRDFKIPVEMENFVAHMLKMPQNIGLPLRVVMHRPDGTQIVIADTKQIVRKPLPKDIFKTPPGYKRVSSEYDLFVSDEKKDSLEDLFR